jgi:hypothetical protein
MKTQEEIEHLAEKYADGYSTEEAHASYIAFIDGYEKCKVDMANTMYDLLAWYMSDKGEQYRNETLFVDVVKDYINSLNKQD